MQPDIKKITIGDNIAKVKELLAELVLAPRINLIRWSALTKQTPNIRIGYPGQHLASLVTGVAGERTGARGNDLSDGSEVKSCSRIDQLDQCLKCKYPVSRLEPTCPNCGSDKIKRNNDSKWLFSIRSEAELRLITQRLNRILLVIGDYPDFTEGDYATLRFQAFEIWPKHPRNAQFVQILTNYYNKIYLEHKRTRPNSNPAPKNFWPYQYQFYLCNPILTFSCVVTEANTSPKIIIEKYLEPKSSREKEPSVIMPVNILKESELEVVLGKASEEEIKSLLVDDAMSKSLLLTLPYDEKKNAIKGIDENLRRYLVLRDTDRISTARSAYERRATI